MRSGSEFIVDFNILKDNLNLLRSFAPKNEIIFMVKANAYGHGLLEVTRYAFETLHIKRFGCASLGEAAYIRKHLPSIAAELWVFSDNEIENSDVNQKYYEQGVTPVLSSISQIKYVLDNQSFKNTQLVFKFDTGMNRLGIEMNQVNDLIELLKARNIFEVQHLMTHFASSFLKLKDGDKTHQQYEKFNLIKKKFSDAGIKYLETSCANSGAIEQKFSLEESHIRPGLMLYGPRSVGSFKKEHALWNGRNISSLVTTVLKVSRVKKGCPIGYGGHVCHADGVIVVLPVGYGDGILTYYSGAKLSYNNLSGKIIGRVNMDLVSVFFESASLDDFELGDKFTIWSHEQEDIVEFASQVRSVPYQVFTAIPNRIPKRFIS